MSHDTYTPHHTTPHHTHHRTPDDDFVVGRLVGEAVSALNAGGVLVEADVDVVRCLRLERHCPRRPTGVRKKKKYINKYKCKNK
jgi:hypothetical protein